MIYYNPFERENNDITFATLVREIVQEDKKKKQKENKAPHAKKQSSYEQAVDVSCYDKLLAELSGD